MPRHRLYRVVSPQPKGGRVAPHHCLILGLGNRVLPQPNLINRYFMLRPFIIVSLALG